MGRNVVLSASQWQSAVAAVASTSKKVVLKMIYASGDECFLATSWEYLGKIQSQQIQSVACRRAWPSSKSQKEIFAHVHAHTPARPTCAIASMYPTIYCPFFRTSRMIDNYFLSST